MLKPIIAGNKPEQVDLKKGQEYYFCACGRSKTQPFCRSLPRVRWFSEGPQCRW